MTFFGNLEIGISANFLINLDIEEFYFNVRRWKVCQETQNSTKWTPLDSSVFFQFPKHFKSLHFSKSFFVKKKKNLIIFTISVNTTLPIYDYANFSRDLSPPIFIQKSLHSSSNKLKGYARNRVFRFSAKPYSYTG